MTSPAPYRTFTRVRRLANPPPVKATGLQSNRSSTVGSGRGRLAGGPIGTRAEELMPNSRPLAGSPMRSGGYHAARQPYTATAFINEEELWYLATGTRLR
jgi:hypothetical protein